MSYFTMLLWLRIKSSLRMRSFWIGGIFFIVLVTLLGSALSRQEPAALQIGIAARGDVAQQALALLRGNEDYQILEYDEITQMQQDVLRGKLHCAYLLDDDSKARAPITALATEQAYMRPLIDQLIFAAYYEAGVPRMTQGYLEELGISTQDLDALFEQVKREATPLTVKLLPIGSERALILPERAGSMLPMMYAVMTSLFVAISILKVLLGSPQQAAALAQLRTKRPFATPLASVCSDLVLHLGLLLVADLSLGRALQETGYPLPARLCVFLLLALFTALITVLLTSLLKRWSIVVSALVPVWLMVSVLLSGALISPDKLPVGIALLRFLSPAWYALQLLGG